MRFPIVLVLAVLLSAAVLPAQDEGSHLRSLIRTDGEGSRPLPDAWPDLSTASLREKADQDRAILAALEKIPRFTLRAADRTLYDLFQRKIDGRLRQLRLRMYLTPFWLDDRFSVRALESPWMLQAAVDELSSPVLAARLRLRKMDAFPDYVAQIIALMRQGGEAGMLPARADARRFLPRAFGEAQFLEAFDRLYESPEEQARIREEARRLIRERVLPALDGFVSFLNDEYLPSCPEQLSLPAWPDGGEIFRELVRRETTTEMDPEDIYGLGTREVARIRDEMPPVVRALGWQGTLDGFLAAAGTDPQYYFSSEDGLLSAYRAAEQRIAALVPQVSSYAPEAGIGPMRNEQTPGVYMPAARQILVDVSRLDLHPRFEMIPLLLHEGAPGHAVQTGLQQAFVRAGPPEFETVTAPDRAYAEGWGLYAESLGEDLGLYSDPLDKFGELSMQLLRAVRAVIDTGVHEYGWSAEQAEQYFVAQTGRPAAMARAEVERTATPGAQLAYLVGFKRFEGMRARASSALGGAFDLRRFDDTLLSWGVLPFDLLQEKLEECLSAGCLTPSGSQR